jgi:hypothetical protein
VRERLNVLRIIVQTVSKKAVSIISVLDMYRYRPLKRETHEIRLVKVLPGHFEDTLQLNIEHVPLVVPEPADDKRLSFNELAQTISEPWIAYKTIEGRYIFYNTTTERTQWNHPTLDIDYDSDPFLLYPGFTPHYEALSYAWGNDTSIIEVEVIESVEPVTNSRRASILPIRPNLYQGLKHLRYLDKPRTLWVDAICVNQDDMAERNVEVKRMDNIFKLASRVVVWLGLASSDGSSQHALDLLRYLGEQVEYSTSMAFLRAPTAQEQDWYDYDIPLPFSDKDYSAIQELLESSWWDRLWIWQEIHLANSQAVFQCGSGSIDWSSLRRAILNLRERRHPTMSTLLNARVDLARDHKNEAVLDLIFRTRKALYTTPHDRIFALFGLFDSGFVDHIQSDYSLSLADVFQNVCLAIMQYYGHLKFLEYCDIAQATIDNMPSWVPNWSTYPSYEKLDLGFASGRSAASSTSSSTGSCLKVHGVTCGIVQDVGHKAPLEGNVRAVLQSWEAQIPPGEENKEAFVATLLDGHIDERWPNRGNVSLERNIELYDRFMAGNEVGGFKGRISRNVRGRSLFQTNSHIGLSPPSVKIGKQNISELWL